VRPNPLKNSFGKSTGAGLPSIMKMLASTPQGKRASVSGFGEDGGGDASKGSGGGFRKIVAASKMMVHMNLAMNVRHKQHVLEHKQQALADLKERAP